MLGQDTRPAIGAQPTPGGLLLRGISILIALVGLWLLIQSASIGLGAADAMVSARGSVPAEQLLRLVDAQTAAYRLIGAVLLGVGTARSLFTVR
jgi:hypothetical protein